MNASADLSVNFVSSALTGKHLDLVVSGSIGAVESVRFIRALRRLGAEVYPWLTQGGASFVTETALSWAANRPAITQFSGANSHVGHRDGCIIAPASANFLYKLSHGITDDPASALVTSYIGARGRVAVVPNMHDSFWQAPAVQENLQKVASWGVKFIGARKAEHKQKFPEPQILADQIANFINAPNVAAKPLVVMGATRGYIDDVRYVSNYSSGALGTAIAQELYRRGANVEVVCGPSRLAPEIGKPVHHVETNEQMRDAAEKLLAEGSDRLVMLASVLDFVPEKRETGKISSNQNKLELSFRRSEKIIAQLKPRARIKVGFKLTTDIEAMNPAAVAADYMKAYDLSMFVINQLSDVDETRHRAIVFSSGKSTTVEGKLELSAHIADHVLGNSRA